MMRNSSTRRVERPVANVFDFVAVRCYENHPKWEDAVIEIRPAHIRAHRYGKQGPHGAPGLWAHDQDRVQVTAYEPDRLISFRHDNPKMRFAIAFQFMPVGEATDLRVDVEAQPMGFLKVMEPMMRWRMPKTSQRIVDRLKAVVEADQALT
jgi:hypothetical protein